MKKVFLSFYRYCFNFDLYFVFDRKNRHMIIFSILKGSLYNVAQMQNGIGLVTLEPED